MVFRPQKAEEFENVAVTGHYFECVRGELGQGNHVIIVMSSFLKNLRLPNLFRPHKNEKPAFSNSSDWKSVFRKAPFS